MPLLLAEKLHAKLGVMTRAASKGVSREDLSFACACFVMFVDVMGNTFAGSVIVPYSLQLNPDPSYASLLLVVRFGANFLSNIYMPIIGDKCGRTLCALLSLAGSCVAYVVCGCAAYYPREGNVAWWMLCLGKVVEGLFAGTAAAMMAYTMELSVPRMGLLKMRYAVLISMMFGVPAMLQVRRRRGETSAAANAALTPLSRPLLPRAQPIGGSLATFSMQLPFFIMAAVAAIALIVVAVVMREAKTIRGLQERGKGFWCDCNAPKQDGDGSAASSSDLEVEEEEEEEQEGETDAAAPTTEASAVATVKDVAAPKAGDAADGYATTERAAECAIECAAERPAEETQETHTRTLCCKRLLRSPYFDPTLLFFSLGSFCFGLTTPVLILIPPLVFAHPDFGLEIVGDSDGTQAKIAQAVSLTVTASSALTVVGLLVTYQLLQRIAKLSDFVILIGSGALLALTTGLHGFASTMWQFAIFQGFFGAFLGPFLGAFINFKNPYVLNLFPNDMAAANSIYQVRVLFSSDSAGVCESLFSRSRSVSCRCFGRLSSPPSARARTLTLPSTAPRPSRLLSNRPRKC